MTEGGPSIGALFCLSRNAKKKCKKNANTCMDCQPMACLLFPGQDMRGTTYEDFGSLPNGFGECRMRVDGQGHVLGYSPHFNRQDAFGNQRFGMLPNHAHAQHAV